MNLNVNLLAVLVSAVVQMFIGYVYYHPKVFGNAWMKLVGITAKDIESKKSQTGKTYGLMFVASLVMAYVLAIFVQYAGATTATAGAMVGFWAWLGFSATGMFSSMLFEGRPMKLFAISAGYLLVSMLVVGGLLAAWQ